MASLQTAESKVKGDEGIYAAIDAARLARALRGATLSRLSARDRMIIISALSTSHPLQSSPPPQDVSNSGGGMGPMLGAPPRIFEPTNASENIRARIRQEVLQDPLLDHDAQVPIGIPESIGSPAFRELVPYLQKVRPGKALSFDELQKLLQMTDLFVSKQVPRGNVTTLDLAGCAIPSSVAAAGAAGAGEDKESDSVSEAGALAQDNVGDRISVEALEKVMLKLQERYPLPIPKDKKKRGADDREEDEDEEDEEEEEDREALRHNEELRARCELLQIPYTTYHTALHDVALYETEIFPLICQFLSSNDTIKVVLMSHNRLGAESGKAEGSVDLRALRALATMLDANETIKVLDLSHNELGPNGIGIVAKALTKNICLQEIDLSENKLNAEALEEMEDPEFTEEDPVFGERYSGLEAISEILKKNKFLRILRLGGNGIHAGDDLTAPAEEDNGGVEEEESAAGTATAVSVPTPEDVIAGWEEAPLWRLLQPLQLFHRLTVLDLRGNQLGVLGARMLATALSKNRSVRALDLTDNGIGYRGLHYLASLVLASPTSELETLCLQRNDLAGKSRNPNTQKKLRLKPKKAALAAMHAFAAAMQGNRKVRRLVLSENHLGPLLSAAMLSTISQAEMLEELDFSWNEACGDHESVLDLTAVSSLATALYPSSGGCGMNGLPPHRPTLKRLYISGNNLCAAGLAALFPGGGLVPEYALQELDLSRNYVGDALEPLSHLLQVSPTLARLNLAYNNVTSLSAVLPGLRENDSLEGLDVSHNKLGSMEEQRHLPADFGGATVNMVGSLKNPQTLQAAAIQTIARNDPAACVAQRDAIDALWQCLAHHRTLSDLNLSWNDLREDHAMDFLHAFSNPAEYGNALAKVDISHNPKIPAVIVQSLLAALASRPGMTVVYTSLPRKAPAAAATVTVTALPQSGDDDALQAETRRQQTAADVAEAMTTAVANSNSLLDLSCWGLCFGDSAEETVESMRRRLLLNALLAGSA